MLKGVGMVVPKSWNYTTVITCATPSLHLHCCLLALYIILCTFVLKLDSMILALYHPYILQYVNGNVLTLVLLWELSKALTTHLNMQIYGLLDWKGNHVRIVISKGLTKA